MKLTRSCVLVWTAFIVSVTVIFIFYLLSIRNLTNTVTQSENEQIYQSILYHLGKFQLSYAEMESSEKMYLLNKNETNFSDFQKATDTAKNQINYLKEHYNPQKFLYADILNLYSLFSKELAHSEYIIKLYNKGNRDSAVYILTEQKYILLRSKLIAKYEILYDQARIYLKSSREYHNSELKTIYKLMGFSCIGTLVILSLIFWLLMVQTAAKDRRLAEKKIFASIINNSSDAIFVTDADHKMIYCNKATENLYKFKMADILGKHVFDVIQTRSSKENFDEKIQALNTKGYWIGEVKSISTDEDGHPNNLYTTINIIKNNNGKTIAHATIAKDITVLKRAQAKAEQMSASLERINLNLEEKVREQTTLIREVFDRIKDGFLAADLKFNITYANNIICELLNITGNESLGKNIFTLLIEITGKENVEYILNSFLNQEVRAFAFLHIATQKWFQVNIFPSANGISMHFKDITVSKKANEEIQKSKRLYKFSSKINDHILYAKTEEAIFSEICNIAVQTGGFLFSWIAVPDYQTNTLKSLVRANLDTGYIEAINEISIIDITEGRGPSGIAFREGKYHYCNDIENDPIMAVWRYEALNRGYRSAVALPIKVDGVVIAVFMLYGSKPFLFNEDELQLLERVTENISFALNALNITRKGKITEIKLNMVSKAVEQSAASIIITDVSGKIEYINPAFSKLTGYSFEETIGQNPRILKTGYTDNAEYRYLWENLLQKKGWQGIFCNKKKNGEIFWEYANISPILNEDGTITNFVAVKENITEKRRLEEEQKQLIKIIENTTAFVGTADLNKNFLYANKAMKEALGIGIDEDITKYNISEFKTAKGVKITSEMDKALKETEVWTGENSYKSVKGKEISVWQVVVVHKDEQGMKTHISTTAIDLSKIKEAEKKLLLANKELRNLSRHLLHIREMEKKDIAREIHDELGQNLTILSMHISLLKTHLNDDQLKVKVQLDEITTEIKDTIGAFRRIHSSLHPAMLEESGLHTTVKWLVDSTSKSIHIPINFSSNIENERIVFDKSLALYRVIQESLTNIIRYAKATRISISLIKQKNTLILNIEDNGCGFIVSKVDTKLHHGLLGIRERVYATEGKFTISSVIDEGTIISVEMPI